MRYSACPVRSFQLSPSSLPCPALSRYPTQPRLCDCVGVLSPRWVLETVGAEVEIFAAAPTLVANDGDALSAPSTITLVPLVSLQISPRTVAGFAPVVFMVTRVRDVFCDRLLALALALVHLDIDTAAGNDGVCRGLAVDLYQQVTVAVDVEFSSSCGGAGRRLVLVCQVDLDQSPEPGVPLSWVYGSHRFPTLPSRENGRECWIGSRGYCITGVAGPPPPIRAIPPSWVSGSRCRPRGRSLGTWRGLARKGWTAFCDCYVAGVTRAGGYCEAVFDSLGEGWCRGCGVWLFLHDAAGL